MEFLISGKRITLPNNWREVTLGQLLAIRGDIVSTLDVIAILSGVDAAFWRGVNPADIVNKILPALEWSNEPFDWNSLEVPIWYHIAEKKPLSMCRYVLNVPMNLDLETYGQKVYIESLIGNEMSDADRVPMVLAAYFEPVYSGKDFNTERLAEFLPVILETACTEALPIYSFFYRKYRASMLSTAG